MPRRSVEQRRMLEAAKRFSTPRRALELEAELAAICHKAAVKSLEVLKARRGDEVHHGDEAKRPVNEELAGFEDAAGAEVSLTQSLPIIEMLADLCDGVGKRSLRPVDLTQRARAPQIAEIFNAGTQPLQNLSHIKEMQGPHAPNPRPAAVLAPCRPAAVRSSAHPACCDGPHAAGERPTDVIDGRAIAKAAIVRGCAAAEARSALAT